MWRFPWIPRFLYEDLKAEISDLKRERQILYDRLATLGLGGPLFTLPSSPDSSPITEPEEESISEEEQEQIYMASLRPSKRAHYLEWKMKRDRNRVNRGPSVAHITPDPVAKVAAALEQAEQAGKSSAGAEFVKSTLAVFRKKQA